MITEVSKGLLNDTEAGMDNVDRRLDSERVSLSTLERHF